MRDERWEREGLNRNIKERSVALQEQLKTRNKQLMQDYQEEL